MEPHESAKELIQSYSRYCKYPLDIVYNPDWYKEVVDPDGTRYIVADPGIQYMIIQKVITHEEHEDVDGLSYSKEVDFPVLFVPHASYGDNRWITALEEGRTVQFKERLFKQKERETRELRKKWMDQAEDFASYNYDLFKAEVNKYNLSQISNVDPYRKRKEFAQKKGRRLGSKFKWEKTSGSEVS